MIIPNGKADVTTYFVLRDSTNHAPKTDVTITDIDLYYVEEGAAISAKADATALAAADSAHSDSKAFHVGQGLYRIDWPDAAFDGGVGKTVQLIVVCTGVDTTFLEVLLSPEVNIYRPAGAVATDAGNSATAFKTTLTSAVNDFWVGAYLKITSGALSGQVRKVSDYDGTTKIITLASALTGTPADGVTFSLVNE